MPDGLFHVAAADLAGRCRSRHLPHLLLGAILPDILSRPLARVIPYRYAMASDVLHTPVVTGLIAIAYLLIFVREDPRRAAGRALALGLVSHYLLDALQTQMADVYFWFFPFSWASGGIDLFWPEESLLGIPFLLAAIAVIRGGRTLARRRREALMARAGTEPSAASSRS
ncbi:MAG: hypothetical protein JXP34_17040 [Planctomycetes bacterium]|nr:hypothetical protein [Planctomycetota bacterium]